MCSCSRYADSTLATFRIPFSLTRQFKIPVVCSGSSKLYWNWRALCTAIMTFVLKQYYAKKWEDKVLAVDGGNIGVICFLTVFCAAGIQILPLVIRNVLNLNVRQAVMKVSRVFQRICSKVVNKSWEEELINDAVTALCMLKKEFPLGFFNIMTHLIIHLAEELFICGPVHTRWMYPMERYMKFLKDYVHTKARPEGSMAEGYMMDDALGFCTEYMTRFTSTRRRVWDDQEEPGLFDEEPEGGGERRCLNDNM